MLASLVFICAFAPDEPAFNGLKVSEWIAMAKDDPLPRKRKAAIIALGQLITKETQDTVLLAVAKAMRSDSQASVRLQATLLLAQQPADMLAGYIPDLTEGLRQEKDAAVKREQAIALGRLGKASQAAVLPLIDALKDAPLVRAAAADALGRIGPGANAAAPILIPLTKDSDRSVKLAAVFALGRVDPADPDPVVATLVSLLADVNARQSTMVPHSALAGGLASANRESELVATAVISLGLLGVKTPEAVRAMADQFADPDPDVRQQSALALAKLTVATRAAEPELKAALSGDPDKTVRIYASQTIAAAFATEPELMIAFFAERLKVEPEFEVRLAMVEELGALGASGTAAIPALKLAQSDTQVKVREAAGLAIKRITHPTPPPVAKP